MKHWPAIAFGALSTLGSCAPLQHAPSPSAQHAMGGPRMPGACEAPARANEGKLGCYFDEAVDVGTLTGALFWHVDEFPDAATARAAKGLASAVVQAYGRTFLQTVNDDPEWRVAGGRHLASVGPMQVSAGPTTARFMQAMTEPGATTRPHRHSGPEAFYVLSGAICLETPAGARTVRAGETLLADTAVPMQLTSAGGDLRRSLFVVLHPASQPWMTTTPEWTPTGACVSQR